MINPFHYVPCADLTAYQALAPVLVLNGYEFLIYDWDQEKQMALYVWTNIRPGLDL